MPGWWFRLKWVSGSNTFSCSPKTCQGPDLLGFFSSGWIPSSLSPQGMPACRSPVSAARLESPGVSLCPLSAGEMHSETDSPRSAQTQENLHGLGRMTREEAFQNTCCSSQTLLSSSVISLAVLCRGLAQSLPALASSKVSPGCPCSVPMSLLGVTELHALDRPWSRRGWELQVPLLLCAWVSLSQWWELGRQHGLGHMGRLCLHCPKAAWLSPLPREAAGVPRATSHGCANSQDLLQLLNWTWQFRAERVPRPLPGL